MATAAGPSSWAEPRPQGLRRFLPVLIWLPAYDRSLLRFDVIAGATVWGLLVPEMIAYSGLAGLPPQAGLYTLLATMPAYAILGTSRHLVVAGTSAAAVLLASTVGALAVGPSDYVAHAAVLVLFVGGLFLLAGICRLGFIAQFLSRPVMEGFVFGADHPCGLPSHEGEGAPPLLRRASRRVLARARHAGRRDHDRRPARPRDRGPRDDAARRLPGEPPPPRGTGRTSANRSSR